MPAPKPLTAAQKLRRIADEINDIADEYEIPSKTMVRVEMLIGRVERAAADCRQVVRGSGL